MHARLGRCPRAGRDGAAARSATDRRARAPRATFPIATGLKRSGKRLLTVGTDCALGKKYTALSIARAIRQRGIDADFRATGQTGIMIAGRGIPMDAVVADFAAGAAEILSPAAADGHWDVIEGQGSLLHPAYAGVSLSLLHGSQPDVFVVCHDPARERLLGDEDFAVPSVEEIDRPHDPPRRAHQPGIRAAGVSFNTAALDANEARELMAQESARLGLPVADPIRGGPEFERLVEFMPRRDRRAEPVQALAAARPRRQGGGDRRRLRDGPRARRVLPVERPMGRTARDPLRDCAVQHLLLADVRSRAAVRQLRLPNLLQAIARPRLAAVRAQPICCSSC